MALLDFMPLSVSLSISFSSDYYHAHAGSRFTEDVLAHPLARYEQKVRQWEYRKATFPEMFGNEGRPNPDLGIGVPTNPRIFGCQVRYREHMDAHALPLLRPDEDPATLKLPDIQHNMQWLYDEIDVLVDHGWNKHEIGLPDLQGPLNMLFRVVGDTRMLSLLARNSKAEVVHHLLDLASDLYIEVHLSLRKATGRPMKTGFTASGCTYYYLSPAQFTTFILPVIAKCEGKLGEHVGLHHCGEASTDKIEAYARYPWRSATFGFGSDLRRARELMVHPRLGPIELQCRVSPYRMLNQPAPRIREDIEWITAQVRGGPASIHLVGCPNDTPVENIHALREAVLVYNTAREREEEQEGG